MSENRLTHPVSLSICLCVSTGGDTGCPRNLSTSVPAADWLTAQGHWVRVRALLLIKPAINISITICTYFRDGQAGLEKAIFPLPRKCFFYILKTFQKLNQTTLALSSGIGK